MKVKLGIVSVFTLAAISAIVYTLLALIVFIVGYTAWIEILIIVILYNILLWYLSPYILDFIYKKYYQVRFYSVQDVAEEQWALVANKICKKHISHSQKSELSMMRTPQHSHMVL